MRNKADYDSVSEIFSYSFRDILALLTGITYLCSDVVRGVFRKVFKSFAGVETIATIGISIILLVMFFLVCILDFGRKKRIKVWPVYLFVAVTIISSVLSHPEFSKWFTHEEYGLSITIFPIYSAIFGLAFISLLVDKHKILTTVVWSFRINLLWHLYQYYSFLKRGYWESYLGSGELIRTNYSLVFGYQVILCAILFWCIFLYNHQIIDMITCIISLGVVILAGSRGPILCFIVAVVLIFCLKWKNSRSINKKFFVILLDLYCYILAYQS